MSRNFRFATFGEITLSDLEEAFTYFKKEHQEEMNSAMKDVLDKTHPDCSYKERLIYEDIFKKAYVSAFIRVENAI